MDIAVDGADNLYTLAYTEASLLSENRATLLGERRGEGDARVARFNSEGECAWISYVGSDGVDSPISIQATNAGETYTLLSVKDARGFPELVWPIEESGMRDLVIALLDQNGIHRKSMALGGSRVEAAYGPSTLWYDGDALLVAMESSSATLSVPVARDCIRVVSATGSQRRGLVVRVARDLTHAEIILSVDGGSSCSIQSDERGQWVAAMQVEAGVEFDGELQVDRFGGSDILVVRAAGNAHWMRSLGSPSGEFAPVVLTDWRDRLWVLGATDGNRLSGGCSVEGTREGRNVFCSQIGLDGRYLRTLVFGGNGYDMITDAVRLATGEVVAVLDSNSSRFPLVNREQIPVGREAPVGALNPVEDRNGVVVLLNEAGELSQCIVLGGNGHDYCSGVTMDQQGRIHVIGSSNSAAFLGRDDLSLRTFSAFIATLAADQGGAQK